MRSYLGNFTPVYDKYLIGIPYRCQPVCNGNQRFPARQLPDGCKQRMLVFRIHAGGRLIKNNDGSIF
ncbi:hypothetical protein SDC9_65698 [bioreactor metagenome]|uniref:Uncharacterized protein n=1 Tax=bioreactor metagenome TaxID=1076179 RepID=A0A644XTN8_9ZZZZ